MAHHTFEAVSDEHGKKITDNGFSVTMDKKKEEPKGEGK
tara:strand:+ start:2645 stop:2761 length:117 start_codon:yes stop_codon:yes gene_type:complete